MAPHGTPGTRTDPTESEASDDSQGDVNDDAAAIALVNIQQKFYENNASFVICELQKPVERFLEEKELFDLMNITPTESEAWDIIQMEEIERELLDGNQL